MFNFIFFVPISYLHPFGATKKSTKTGEVVEKEPEANQGAEVLPFRLGKEEYGIDILKVQEIRGYENVTRIANAPDFIKGVMNLRGIIVPIIDMRIRFNLGTPIYDQFTVVIILNVGNRVIGMVVDSVSDVTQLSEDQIKPAPEMGAVLRTDYLLGMGVIEDRMLILLDIERLMTNEDLILEQAIAA